MGIFMIDIAVKDLNKYYGSNHVLKGMSFEIKSNEKVGLLGKNGSGKTTVFKILGGKLEYEGGDIIKASGRKVEILEQVPEFNEAWTVEDVLQSAFGEVSELRSEMKRLESLIASEPSERTLNRYGQLQTGYEAMGGYECDSKTDRICMGINISTDMRGQLFSTLSGGEKTRVNLSRILLREADILLLDEPTNHLDLKSLQWLEQYIGGYGGTVIVISHDRYFLDGVVSRIIEIEDGKAEFYEGNYSFYALEKQRRFTLQNERYEQQQRKIGQMEAAAKRMHEWAQNADNPGMHRRAFSMEKRIERMDKIHRPAAARKLTADFRNSSFSGEEMVWFREVGKEYDGKVLFDGVDLKVFKDDRIAVMGENGCGKSTLIRILMGLDTPDRGAVAAGNSLKAAYMPQMIEFENKEASVLESLRYFLETSEEKARSILAGFNFIGVDVFKKVGSLSGGEKSRLKMCMLMQGDCNLLVLDEPTNHLDIASREWVEEAVSQYEGTLMFISHDRYFLNKFANRIWAMSGVGITDFKGTFDEYCAWLDSQAGENSLRQTAESGRKGGDSRKVQGGQVGIRCGEKAAGAGRELVSAQKQRDLLEEEITEKEQRLKVIQEEMEEAAEDFERLNGLYSKKTKTEGELERLYYDWEEVSGRLGEN